MMHALDAAAAKLVGAPFRHQGRDPRYGIDCLGVLVHAIGGDALEHDRSDYTTSPDASAVVAYLRERFDRVGGSIDDAPAGSILVFTFGSRRIPRHFAVRSATGMIHAERGVGVIDEPITDQWRDRFSEAYAWQQ